MKGGAKSSNTFEEPKPTHKGWLGVCPILIADPFGNEPTIEARHWVAKPLLHLVVWFYMVMFNFIGFMFPGYPCSWPLRITGKVIK